jgi:hypothetical protein
LSEVGGKIERDGIPDWGSIDVLVRANVRVGRCVCGEAASEPPCNFASTNRDGGHYGNQNTPSPKVSPTLTGISEIKSSPYINQYRSDQPYFIYSLHLYSIHIYADEIFNFSNSAIVFS